MPIVWSLPMVVLVWLLRASAMRCWVLVILLATWSSQRSVADASVIHHERISAAKAECNWQTVRFGFFPPFLSHLGQEQVAHHRQHQMAFQSDVASALVLVQADFAFLVLEASFDTPARQGHQQQLAGTGFLGRVTEEKLELSLMEHVAGDEQMQLFSGQTLLVFDGQKHLLAFPHDRPVFALLDTPTLPGLLLDLGVVQPVIDPPGLGAAARQTRHLPTTATTATTVGPRCHAWRLEPTHHALGHLGHELLATLDQLPQQFRLAAVAFIERQPIESQPGAERPVIQSQSDLPFGPMSHGVGNASLTATLTIRGPTFRQEQFAIDQAMEVFLGEDQMDRDQAIFDFAQPTAPLFLYARSLQAFFGIAGFVEDADAVGAGMLSGDELLYAITHFVVVPNELTQELLECAWSHARVDGDRLDALLGQIGELPADVDRQVFACVAASEGLGGMVQEIVQFRLQEPDLLSVHALSSITSAGEHSLVNLADPCKAKLAL